MKMIVAVAMLLLLSGCGWFGASEKQRWLETESSSPTRIPEELDQPRFVDLMPIPEVVDFRGLAGTSVEPGLPQALSTSFGVEQIVIRRLGDERWVFLDLPTATIWPQVVLFWEDNHLPVAMLDPRNGRLETEWIVGTEGNPDEIYESITSGSAWSDQDSVTQYKFRVRVEPGVRNGSSELYVEQKQRALGGEPEVDWNGTSDNPELEGKMLSVLAYYLGDRMAQGPSVSLLAAGLQESKATLVAEPSGMVLKYKLNFDRAWATVGAALENARVSVEDLNRSESVYYVYYSLRHDPDPGFFGRLFGRNTDADETEVGQKFEVHLANIDDEIHVTVDAGDAAAADTQTLILRERLLKLIKEYST